MADIRITQAHRLTPEKARAAAQKVADQMVQDYDVTSKWDGDVLLFKRGGVNGRLTLAENQAQLEISLGFLLTALGPMIEEKVSSKMAKIFTAVT